MWPFCFVFRACLKTLRSGEDDIEEHYIDLRTDNISHSNFVIIHKIQRKSLLLANDHLPLNFQQKLLKVYMKVFRLHELYLIEIYSAG